MTERATPRGLKSDRTESPSWEYRIKVGQENFRHVDAGNVTYDERGSSSLTCEIQDNGLLERSRARNGRADVYCRQRDGRRGRDKWHHVFTGEVKHLVSDDYGRTSMEAYGPRNLLERRYFVKGVAYKGYRFDRFIADIRDRFNEKGSRFDIRSGTRYVLVNQPYQGETSLLEALDDVCESAIYIATDRPGYRLLVAPTPRPGVPSTRIRRIRTIGPRDYAPNGLKVPEDTAGPFSRVIAFRRDENGKEVLRAEADVKASPRGRKPHRTEIFWIPEFPGDLASARQQVYDMAALLSMGFYQPTLKTVRWEDGPLFTYDPVNVVQSRHEGGRVVNITYGGLVSRSVLDLVDGSYDLNCTAVKLNEGRGRKTKRAEPLSPYMVRS